jgi:hypothetical protein
MKDRQYDPTDVAEQTRIEEERLALRLQREESEAEDIKWLLKHKQGRSFLWRLLEDAGIFQAGWSPGNGLDGVVDVFWYLGARNLGLKYLHRINELDPEAYSLMVKEKDTR